MTDVKAQDLSHNEWHALLEPYGWADITTRSALMPLGAEPPFVQYEFRVMLKGSDSALGEWAHRSYLLEQARQAVEAVKAEGYILQEAPRIEFGGRYAYRIETGPRPEWRAEASLSFSVNRR